MNLVQGVFKKRPNRFVALVEVLEKEEMCHVPNTGRCKELLQEGTIVYLRGHENNNRKTKYSLVALENRGVLVFIDSQDPNRIVKFALKNLLIPQFKEYTKIVSEKKVGASRLDFYLEGDGLPSCYIEVKGVTLVEGDLALFPDAPSLRATRHLEELITLKEEGFRTAVIFVLQHPLGKRFRPNKANDPLFARTLEKAQKKGVEILAFQSENSLQNEAVIAREVPIDGHSSW